MSVRGSAGTRARGRSRSFACSLVLVLAVAVVACGSGGAAPPAGPAASDAVAAGPGVTGAEAGTGVSAAAGAEGQGPVTSTGSPQPTAVAHPGPPPSAPASTLDPAVAKLTGPALDRYLAGRYKAFWDAFDAARAKPTANPAADYPKLAQLAAGDQLATSYAAVAQLARAGQALREPATPAVSGTPTGQAQRVRVESVNGAVAQLTSCTVNDDQVVTASTGAVVRAGVASVRATATMAVSDGQWKLIRSEAVQIDPGVAGCWLDAGAFPY